MRTFVGVDIGEYGIKCVVLKKVGDSYCIRKKKYYKSSENTNNLILNVWLSEVLDDFTKENKIKLPVYCITAPESFKNEVKICSKPVNTLSKKDMIKSMQLEFEERALVEELSSVVYKWCVTDEFNVKNNVILTFAEKAFIRQFDIKKRFSTVSIIEPQSVSLGRVVNGYSIVIDFGHTDTRIMAYRNGLLWFTQRIKSGGELITNWIEAQKYNLPEELQELSGEQIKHDFGAVLIGVEEIETSVEIKRTAKLIEEPIQKLGDDIKHLINTLEISEDFTPEKVYYTGGAAKLRFLTDYIGKEIKHDLSALNITDEVDLVGADYDYTSAVATCLYQVFNYCKAINYSNINEKEPVKKYLNIMVYFLILTNISTLVLNTKINSRLYEANNIVSELNLKINSINSQISTENSIINQLLENERVVTSIKDKLWLSDILFELPNKTPVGVSLTEIRVKEGVIQITGKAENYSDIAFLVVALEEIGAVNIKTITVNEPLNFELNISVR